MTPSAVLVGPAFLSELYDALSKATTHIEIQCMSFEGDAAGQTIAHYLLDRRWAGVRVRLLIDYFTDFMISDRRSNDPRVRDEALATHRLLVTLQAAGIEVQRTNPLGALQWRCLCRNHKKLFIIDDAAYLGGINVSDHNFIWRDYMVRVPPQQAQQLREDFEATWMQQPNRIRPPLYSGKSLRQRFVLRMQHAKKSILISSPYVLDRLTTQLCLAARKRGVAVTIMTAQKSNIVAHAILQPHARRKLLAAGIVLLGYDIFSHAKYAIFDNTTVLCGSCNFNEQSFLLMEDLCLETSQPDLLNDFNALAHADRALCRPLTSPALPRALASTAAVHCASAFLQLYAKVAK